MQIISKSEYENNILENNFYIILDKYDDRQSCYIHNNHANYFLDSNVKNIDFAIYLDVNTIANFLDPIPLVSDSKIYDGYVVYKFDNKKEMLSYANKLRLSVKLKA